MLADDSLLADIALSDQKMIYHCWF